MKTLILVVLTIAASLLPGCARQPPIQLTPEAMEVEVSKFDPADNYTQLGPITAQDGSGCGYYGRRGTHNQAINRLRVTAASMGADYVTILTITQPHLVSENCFANAYTINGMAYEKTSDQPRPIQIKTVDSPTGSPGLVEQLRQLDNLHKSGALTDEEFARAKKRLLQ